MLRCEDTNSQCWPKSTNFAWHLPRETKGEAYPVILRLIPRSGCLHVTCRRGVSDTISDVSLGNANMQIITGNYLAFDVMADIIFGAKKYDLIGKSNYRYVVNAIETSNVRVGVMLQASWIKFARMDKCKSSKRSHTLIQ